MNDLSCAMERMLVNNNHLMQTYILGHKAVDLKLYSQDHSTSEIQSISPRSTTDFEPFQGPCIFYFIPRSINHKEMELSPAVNLRDLLHLISINKCA